MNEAYRRGARAANNRLFRSDNPYPTGHERICWFDGYFDTRTDRKLIEVFRAYGLTSMSEDRIEASAMRVR